jgi:multiple antibiotic resistance protein
MSAFAKSFLLTYAALFPIVNPLGSAPFFLSFTQFRTEQQRNKLAGQVALSSFFLLLGSVLIGSYVLDLFGISLPIVRIGGGLLVAAFGWRLVNSAEPTSDHADAASSTAPPDAFYPLTMPLTVGPGSMSVAITLGSQKPRAGLEHIVLLGAAVVAGLFAIAATVYVSYRFAQRITAALGTTGTSVVMRLSAFILFCIGIQIVWSGWTELNAFH